MIELHYFKPPDELAKIVRGFTKQTTNGYSIFLNAALTDLERTETLKHELLHIKLNHWERIDRKEITVSQAEKEVDKYLINAL